MSKLLYTGTGWTIDLVEKMWEVIDRIAKEKYQLDYHDTQIEVVTADQMIYFHSMNGMPVMYNHWSFGKQNLAQEKAYRAGEANISYETIINTNPTIAYIMEDNTATMQALVLAHASVGHGSFFKMNYLMQEWTDPDSILNSLIYAKHFVERCEEKYGEEQVERFLDACHALKLYGVDKYKRRRFLRESEREKRYQEWVQYQNESVDEFWSRILDIKDDMPYDLDAPQTWPYPEENILYFIEKNAPHMPQWKRELIRIVRTQAQYFYPQMQTKLMNEGWASFWHYTLMNDLYEEGYIDEGSYMEFLNYHTAVLRQSQLITDHEMDRYKELRRKGLVNAMHGNLPVINPYALGFAMFSDIKRVCENPTEEDKRTMPLVAGQPWLETLKWVASNFKDASFVRELLSPKVIRDFELCCFEDDEDKRNVEITYVQDEDDYRDLRKAFAQQYSLSDMLPCIEVEGFDAKDTRTLYLRHTISRGRKLEGEMEKATHKYLMKLWGYPIEFDKVDQDGNIVSRLTRKHT